MKRKYVISVGIIVLMATMATGCNVSQKAEEKNDIVSFDDKTDESVEQQLPNDELQYDTSKDVVLNKEETNDNSSQNSISIGQDSIIIGGKVRSITQNGFVISRVLVEDGYVTMPEAGSPEEELVTVRYTDATTFECWTIQGGGAGIETKEAVSTDIQEGSGLEAWGNFDGEDFVAERVVLEIYE